MSVQSLAGRDHSIDLFRGLALISIFINHVPGNILEPLTHKNFGLSDSAEVFVLLAGIAAAFAYFPRFCAGQAMLASGKALKRAGLLYVAHLASTVVGLAIFCAAALFFAHPALLNEINIPAFTADPLRGIVGVAALTHQLGYHNILPLYFMLLLVLPAAMALARIDLRLMMAASISLYAATQIYGLNMPNYPTDGGWFFNPFAWQIIFLTGFYVGVRILNGETPVPYVRPLWWLALAYLVFAAIYHRWNLYGSIPEIPFLPHNFQINEKPWVAAPRLAHILALAYVVGHSPLMRLARSAGAANPLAALGRQALPVFWIGTALCMVLQAVFAIYKPAPLLQLPLLAAGLGLQLALAYGLDWLKAAEKSRKAAIPMPERAPPLPAGTMPAH